MDAEPAQPIVAATDTGPGVGRDLLHLFTLTSLSVAQPVYDRLSAHVTFLLDQSVSPATLLLLAALVLLAVPACLSLVELAALCLGRRWQRRAHAACVTLLLAPLSLLLARHVAELDALYNTGLSPYLVLTVGLALVVLLARQYFRRAWIRGLVTWASPAVVVFPVVFLTQGPARVILFPPPPPPPGPQAAHPVPVVIIVFDEFSGMSLVNGDHQIDAVRYPNFARLAETATWCRNATTVHPRTGNAVPSLLTGRMPYDGNAAPIEANYPRNLFRYIQDSKQFEMVVFEPRTRVASLALEKRPAARPPGAVAHAAALARTVVAVYLHTCLPRYLPVSLPPLPRAWHGMPEADDDTADRRSGLIRYAWDTERDVQVGHFLQCVRDAGRPEFFFLHVGLPHHPWTHLPSGRSYAPYDTAVQEPVGGYGPNGELWTTDELVVRHWWQRYLLQVQFADQFIGRLQDRLVEAGLFDRCLLIVTADHGVSFMPGHSRRDPDGANLADILSVPLFVKLPQQSRGEVSDRNVESIDVLPTIADILDYELPGPVDGQSLLDDATPPRPRKSLFRDGSELAVVEAAFPAKYDSVGRMLAAFGSGSDDDRLWASPIHPELVGRDIAEFQVREESPLTVALRIGGSGVSPEQPDLVPCCYEGRVVNWGGRTGPAVIAVAVNGQIVCTARTSVDDAIRDWWFALAPEAAYRPGENDVRFYAVEFDGDRPVLVPCRTAPWHERWDRPSS